LSYDLLLKGNTERTAIALPNPAERLEGERHLRRKERLAKKVTCLIKLSFVSCGKIRRSRLLLGARSAAEQPEYLCSRLLLP